MELYNALHLGDLESSVALIKNVTSHKMGKKDIIKVDEVLDVDLDVLGFIDPNITVNIIKDNEIVGKKHIELPKKVTNLIKCKNPRCITSTEQELPHIFKLTDPATRTYRCIYCETKARETRV